MADNVPTTLRKLRKRAGLSLDRFAKAAGFSGSSSVQRYFEDDYGEPTLRLETARRFAKALVGRGTPPISEAEVLALAGVGVALPPVTAPLSELSPPNDLPAHLAAAGAWPRDVPVYGVTVGGSDGDFMLNVGQVVDFARRPPTLGRRTVFALYVQGASMSPWRVPGGLVFLDPVRPARFTISSVRITKLSLLSAFSSRMMLMRPSQPWRSPIT